MDLQALYNTVLYFTYARKVMFLVLSACPSDLLKKYNLHETLITRGVFWNNEQSITYWG